MTKAKENKKYWYKTDVYSCVICGAEQKYRERVSEEKDKGVHWHSATCNNHF